MFSRTYLSQYVVLLAAVLAFFGVELPYTQEEIIDALVVVLTVFGALWAIVERFSKGDVTLYGKKTTTKKK